MLNNVSNVHKSDVKYAEIPLAAQITIRDQIENTPKIYCSFTVWIIYKYLWFCSITSTVAYW